MDLIPLGDRPPEAESPAPPDACALVRDLERLARRGDRRRRIVVARTQGEGRELMRQVALRFGSWTGFEVTTVRPFARRCAADRLAKEGARVLDEFDEHALIENAIDEAMSQVAEWRELAEKAGVRRAVQDSIRALRLAGIRARPRHRRAATGPVLDKRSMVTRVLARYEALLAKGRRTDAAGVLAAAIAALRDGDSTRLPKGAEILLTPGHSARGLTGCFVGLLRENGAKLLRGDPVVGLPVPSQAVFWDAAGARSTGSYLHAVERLVPPAGAADGPSSPSRLARLDIELFAAASVADELRGVLRRVVAMGARWDQVEIVASRPAAYGSALHAIAETLGIPVTFAVGLPVERTRPGRIASAYFRWIESGFMESVFRRLIESGDVIAPRPAARRGRPRPPRPPGGPRLARSLRRLRIGWGRDRYLEAIERAVGHLDGARPRYKEDDDSFRRRKKRWGDDLRALDAIVRPVLAATPDAEARTSPALVATGVKALLERMSRGTETDNRARERLVHRLDRIEATVTRDTDFASAMAIVRSYLDIRIPPPRAEGMAPWTSAPGHLYLTDLQHGGATGRPFTFIVGLDATGLHGSLHEDPLLSDGDRARLGRGALRLAADRVAESRFNFAQLFARLRGAVTLSHARWNPAESREVTPAPELLQALRLRAQAAGLAAKLHEDDPRGRVPHLGFEELNRHLGLAESRMPRDEIAADLDAADVWLRALDAGGGRFRNGIEAVRRAHPRIDRGLAARDALRRAEASAYTGFLGPVQGETASPAEDGSSAGDAPSLPAAWDSTRPAPDPASDPAPFVDPSALVFSASSLQALGACPRRFFLGRVLGARPPDDPEFDPERWLNAAERGSVLHRVYEQTLADARDRGLDPADDAFRDLALEHLDRLGNEQLVQTPSPSKAVQGWEMDALREDVRSFVEMIRDRKPQWSRLEWKFGGPDGVEIGTTDAFRVRGIVDRVDDHGAHLVVVDYKTGSDYAFTGWHDKVYQGGRRLQHFLYRAAVEAELERPVDRMEYHFPTTRGENRVRPFPAAQKLADGGDLIAHLFEWLRRGWFPPTDNAREDCRYCDFGDVCGVRLGAWGSVSSPYADWTQRNLGGLRELDTLARVRGWEKKGRKR